MLVPLFMNLYCDFYILAKLVVCVSVNDGDGHALICLFPSDGGSF